ncbi:MAG: 2,3-bisphosphoglycerate-independent phosphoglycerate mutase [Magnetococcales bacterium]|nr:2,3-bisphosphoglycerate-independent phosphoglycerate mutase [Magnetococcales bacterium]
MVLVILDGWGVRQESDNNAIYHAQTPNFDNWISTCPNTTLQASAGDVGLPDGQMGNSEVGHVNLGAGRIVYQDYARINRAIADGSFYDNAALNQAIDAAKSGSGVVHIMGLLSPGGVHSHTSHMEATVKAARDRGIEKIFVHGFLDGRDTPPRSALDFIDGFEKSLGAMKAGVLASVCGRYYAMDRDMRWDRVAQAYEMLTEGKGLHASSARAAVHASYEKGEDDEFVRPTLMVKDGKPLATIADGDAVLMINFRADRAREISHAFTTPSGGEGGFNGFERNRMPALSAYLCMTQYDKTLQNILVGYPPERPARILPEELAGLELKQLRAAETEKYAHVTYFFNGGREDPFPGEDRLMIKSPDVATYDLQPEMSANALTDAVLQRLEESSYDFIAINYANPDMVGHTGKFEAAVEAIGAVDRCVGRLVARIQAMGGEVLITADHGNADMMVDTATGQAHTAHTTNPVPLIYVGREAALKPGRLSDVAPTILALMGLPQPAEMSGEALVTLQS